MTAEDPRWSEPCCSGFSIPSVVGNLSGNVGYVRITGFYKNTAAEFKEAVAKLREQGAESIIFDVRNTSKGSIDYAAQVIDVISARNIR